MSINVVEGILIGLTVGIVIILVQDIKKYFSLFLDKKTVYTWLLKDTKGEKEWTVGRPGKYDKWRTTRRIAASVNLPIDRINYICSIHDKIRSDVQLDHWPKDDITELRWGIREFVDDDPPMGN